MYEARKVIIRGGRDRACGRGRPDGPGRHSATGQKVRGAAGEPLSLGWWAGWGSAGSRGPARASGRARAARHGTSGRASRAHRPRWRRRPVSRRVARDRRILRVALSRLIGRVVHGWSDAGRRRHRGRGRLRTLPDTTSMRGLTTRPILEGGADGERAGETVRLLMRDGARGGRRFRETPMSVVGVCRASFAVVAKRDERTGRGTIHTGQPSLSHAIDDTRRIARVEPSGTGHLRDLGLLRSGHEDLEDHRGLLPGTDDSGRVQDRAERAASGVGDRQLDGQVRRAAVSCKNLEAPTLRSGVAAKLVLAPQR